MEGLLLKMTIEIVDLRTKNGDVQEFCLCLPEANWDYYHENSAMKMLITIELLPLNFHSFGKLSHENYPVNWDYYPRLYKGICTVLISIMGYFSRLT